MGFKLFRFYVKNESNSRWKVSRSPVFLDFLWTVPHHYCNVVSLSFQPLSSSINVCALSQYSDLNIFFFFPFWALFPKPRGTIRQCSNLENHHPSATRFVTHILCALLTSAVIILVGAWWTGERAPNYTRALFKHGGCFQPSLPLSYLRLLADAPADTQPLCRRNDQGVKRFRHPRVYSQPDEVTGTLTHRQNTLTNETLWPHVPNWDLCVCADAWQPRQRRPSGVFAPLSDLLTNVFLLVLFEARHPPLRHCQR